MRWPRRRSLVWTFALLLWVGAVNWYWKHRLPLVPLDVIRFDEGWAPINGVSIQDLTTPECRSLLSNGNLVLAKRVFHQGIDGETYFESSGPIRVWDPVHHRVVHDIEEFQERIYQASVCRRGVAILHSGESVAIVNLLAGKVVLQMRAAEQLRIELSPDARLVLLFDHETHRPTIYETLTGRAVFTAESESDEVSFEGLNTAIVRSFKRNETQALNTQTWQPVNQPTSFVWANRYSTDGRWAIVVQRESASLINCVDDREVAVFPEPTELRESQWDFCRQDSELIQIALPGEKVYGWSGPPPTMKFIGDNRLEIFRRATADGRLLGQATVEASRAVPVSRVSSDGRVFIAYHEGDPAQASEFVREQLEYWGIDWSLMRRRDFVAVDATTGKLLTTVTPAGNEYISPIWWETTADFCDAGFTVEAENQLTYFAYPIQRRWMWLFGWSLGPPVLFWFGGRARAHLRRLRGLKLGNAGSEG